MKKLLPLVFILLISIAWQPKGKNAPVPLQPVRVGQDYALFFAVDKYDHMRDLDNPIANAEDIAKELRDFYGFKIEVVKDPTYKVIKNKLNEYKKKYTRPSGGQYQTAGQLLIFFTGHGIIKDGNGFFMPADADPTDPYEKSISYNDWRGKINAINCKHILVALDACHSGTFDPNWRSKNDFEFERPGELGEAEKIIAKHKRTTARLFFTSDGEGDTTPDNSDFAKKFLEGLQNHDLQDNLLTSTDLLAHLKRATPTPHGGGFGIDEASSSFLFFLDFRPDQVIDPAETARREKDYGDWQQAKSSHSIPAYQAYLDNHRFGKYRSLALQRIDQLNKEAFDRRDKIDWLDAVEFNTTAAYRGYLSNHPDGKYANDARNRINVSPPTKPNTASSSLSAAIIALENNMVRIPAGTFTMGCTPEQGSDCNVGEKPAHDVSLSSFKINKFEVTREQWREVMGSDPPELKFKGCGQCPVEGVSWNDVQALIKKFNKMTGKRYRLPTEAEWEYAARGGEKYKYAGSNDIGSVAWYRTNSNNKTHPVGGKNPNGYELYDMSGNLHEWCQDKWHEKYKGAPTDGSAWESGSSSYRVIRGGSRFINAKLCRVAYRRSITPDRRYDYIGFRLAHSL